MNDIELEREKQKLIAEGYGWVNGVFNEGTPEQKIRARELECIEMINSILAYDCRGYSKAKDVLEYQKNAYHNYLEDDIKKLGESKVLELIQGQIDSIDMVDESVFRDSEGLFYNSIKWKD